MSEWDTRCLNFVRFGQIPPNGPSRRPEPAIADAEIPRLKILTFIYKLCKRKKMKTTTITRSPYNAGLYSNVLVLRGT